MVEDCEVCCEEFVGLRELGSGDERDDGVTEEVVDEGEEVAFYLLGAICEFDIGDSFPLQLVYQGRVEGDEVWKSF